jgi:hypothetical protein
MCIPRSLQKLISTNTYFLRLLSTTATFFKRHFIIKGLLAFWVFGVINIITKYVNETPLALGLIDWFLIMWKTHKFTLVNKRITVKQNCLCTNVARM